MRAAVVSPIDKYWEPTASEQSPLHTAGKNLRVLTSPSGGYCQPELFEEVSSKAQFLQVPTINTYSYSVLTLRVQSPSSLPTNSLKNVDSNIYSFSSYEPEWPQGCQSYMVSATTSSQAVRQNVNGSSVKPSFLYQSPSLQLSILLYRISYLSVDPACLIAKHILGLRELSGGSTKSVIFQMKFATGTPFSFMDVYHLREAT